MINRKTNHSRMFKLRILSSLFLLLLSVSALAQKSGYEIWNQMTEAGLTFDNTQTLVEGAPGATLIDQNGKKVENAGRMVMFGGEKEGSSSLITRIMGPNKQGFKEYVETLPKKDEFLRVFLSDFVEGKIRVKNVVDQHGKTVPFDLDGLKGVNFDALSSTELMKKFELFLERGGDKSFSHISKPTRIKIFNGTYTGTTGNGLKTLDKHSLYANFVSLHGNAEKFVDAAHGTSVGWEINFNPQKSYGEFEFMIDWFKNELKNAGQKFEAPGHQWIVYPKTQAVATNADEATKLIGKLGEVEKNIQAYIVLKGIEGGSGIELSNYKDVHKDAELIGYHSTGRGVIRLENDRFKVDGKEAFALEFRAGTKSDGIRRMTQKMLVSRYAANEFDDLADGKSWTLVGNIDNADDYWSDLHSKESLVKRFGVSPLEAEKFFEVLNNASMNKTKGGWTNSVTISQDYLAPLWNWEHAPYISPSKKTELRNLTKTYIKTVANLKDADIGSVRVAMKDWVKTSQVSLDIENYLKPKQKFKNSADAHKYDLKMGAKVDVNQIDLGIEYSARYPLKSNAQFSQVPGQPGKFEWIHTNYGYSDIERKAVIERFAKTLSKELNDGVLGEVTNLHIDGHGHGLDIAYEVKDKNGKKWRVEWDGIGRSYDVDSKRIDNSVRGGHVEIVTPKFVPDEVAMQKLYSAMEKENLVPSTRFGGGHINIDLKPFEGKPKAFARFLGAYLDNRDIMSMMFQHIGRQVGAEPVKVSQEAINWLKNFDGTETELKKFLYDQRFFNTRVGRKTKNNQLNLLAYIQDVIPEEFIHADFDMKNDMWRQTFDVEPKIRKMEFRMFNAPRNAQEAALQIKYTKALLNKALNDTDDVFVTTGKVDYQGLVNNPEAALAKFEKNMKNLGLGADEYRGFMLEGMEVSKNTLSNERFLPLEQKLALHPETQGWGKAVEPRVNNPISSADRVWDGQRVLPEAIAFKQQQMLAREHAAVAKNRIETRGRLNRNLERFPLEVTIDLDEIKKLNDQDALVALYYQKSKTKTGDHQKLLKQIIARPSFKENLPALISSSLEISPGYQKFIADNLPATYTGSHKTSYLESFKSLLESSDPGVRNRALSYLSTHPSGLDAMLEKATELKDRAIIRQVLDATKNIKISDQKGKPLRHLKDLVLLTDDAGSVGQILNLVKQMSPEARRTFYANMMDHPKLQLKELAHNHLRTNFEKDYYYLAQERTLEKATPDDKRLFGKFLKETTIFDNITTAEFTKIPGAHRVGVAKKLLDNPKLNVSKRQAILDHLATSEGYELFRGQLERHGGDVELTKWAYENLTKSKFYSAEDVTHSDAIKSLLSAKDPQISKLGLELLEKIQSPIFRSDVIPATLKNPATTETVKSQLYSKILSSPQMLDEIAEYDIYSQHDLMEAVARDVKTSGPNRVQSAKVLSNLNNKGNIKANDLILEMARSNDPTTRNIALVIYGNTDTKLTHETIAHFYNNKPLTALQLEVIKKGQLKHAEFVKNLSKADLESKKTIDKLWFLFRHSQQTDKANNLKLVEILKKDPDTLPTIKSYLEESYAKGKTDPFARWLVAEAAKPEFKVIVGKNTYAIKDIAYHALMSGDEMLQDEAFKLLKSHNISALDFIANDYRFPLTQYHNYEHKTDDKVIKLLAKAEITASDLNRIKGDSNFHYNLLHALKSKSSDPKSKTILTQLLQKIPGSELDRQLLNAAEYDPPKQLGLILKHRKSTAAVEAMLILQKGNDPDLKRHASEGIVNMMKQSREMKSFAGMETGELLSMLYYRTNNLKGNVVASDFLKDITNKDEFVTHISNTLTDYSSPDKYKIFLLGLLEDPKNIEAMGVKRKDLYRLLEQALSYNNDGPVNSAIMKLVRADKLGLPGDKAKLIVNNSYSYSDEAMETLKFLAIKDPQGKHFEQAVTNVFQDRWRYENQPAIKRKAAELLMVMPQNSVDNVIRSVQTGTESDKMLLLGVAKHRSAAVKKLAQTHSQNPEVNVKMQKTAERIQKNIQEQGIIKKADGKSKCVSKSVQTILQRLSFR